MIYTVQCGNNQFLRRGRIGPRSTGHYHIGSATQAGKGRILRQVKGKPVEIL